MTLAAALTVAAAACGSQHVAARPAPRPAATTARPAPPSSTTTVETTTTVPAPPAMTTVATLAGSTPGYAAPGAAPDGTVPGTWYGYPSVLPVIAQQPGWIDVRLAQRPNQSTAWIQATAATLSQDPYRLVLSLSSAHLTLFDGNRAVLDLPAGIGTPDDPTVTGDYFVTMRVPPPDPGYGPFVLVTSAHSDSITDWDASGDAIIAIHGPIDSYDDTLIGATGARISHGCIRLHDSDLAQLAGLPAGTPLEIVP